VSRAVLTGNSLGGPAAIEAALLTGARVLAVIGVDTFQDMGHVMGPGRMAEMAEAWRRDFPGSMDQSMDQMLRTLLYPDTVPSLYEDMRRRVSKMALEDVCEIFRSFGGQRHGGIRAEIVRTDEVHQRRSVSDGH
jgi:pimeloyl-ACP methyl ester carboxylesterase